MHYRRETTFAVLIALAAVGLKAQQAGGIGRVRWLAGCWEAVSPTRVVEERWSAPRGGTMLNSGRTFRRDTLVEYEMVLLRERGTDLVYEAHPSGQPSAEFTSTTINDSMAVFENPAHDFPKLVGYQVRRDSLRAWVEGSAGGHNRHIDFFYRRVACDAR